MEMVILEGPQNRRGIEVKFADIVITPKKTLNDLREKDKKEERNKT